MFTMLFLMALVVIVSYGLYFLGIPEIVNWKIMLIIVLVLNIFDYHSTVLNIKVEGLEVEANPIIKLLWKKGGMFYFSLFRLLVSSVAVFFIFCFLVRENFHIQAGFTVVLVFVIIRNYASLIMGRKKDSKNKNHN